MDRYFRFVSERLRTLDESKLDKKYLNSEAFAELLVQGAEHASRNTSQERIRRFANIIVNNALGDETARDRTQGIFDLAERISDLDAFVLLSFGPPTRASLRAPTRAAAYDLVKALAGFLGNEPPEETAVAESIVYMDNLGLTWVTQQQLEYRGQSKSESVPEFSVFRSPLGNIVAAAIAPHNFYRTDLPAEGGDWPADFVSADFRSSRKTA